MKLKYYIQSFRLRTLPLSISGILVGSACAAQSGYAKLPVFGFALLTTLCLQILSNISNEVGDLEKGTDNDQRLGPIRSAQSGQLTVQNLKNAMGLFVALSVFWGCAGVCFLWHIGECAFHHHASIGSWCHYSFYQIYFW